MSRSLLSVLVVGVGVLLAGCGSSHSSAGLPRHAVGTYNTGAGNGPTAVAVQGDFAYVVNACGVTCYSPLDVLDVSNHASPSLVGSTEVSWGASGIAAQGTYLYTTGYSANPNYMRIVDVSQPSTPTSAAAFTIAGSHPRAIAVQGTYAYMLDYGSSSLEVIDVSNPRASSFSTDLNSSPNSLPLAGSVRTAAGPSAIAMHGGHAYVVNAIADNLQVLDISDPAHPVVAGTSASLGPGGSSGSSFSGIAVQGSRVYVADYDTNSMQVLDVSHPASPAVIATVSAGKNPDAIFVQGHYAYVLNKGEDTMQVFDVAAPASPKSLGVIPTGAEPDSVVVSGRYAYVANYASSSLQIFDLGALRR
ncbi:MAG TPA: hypothetical protein VLJ42_02785 [Solirubrobacteraceae bacterium]|nr:hypothetical protein [Solirubrobacteraceae bacterium]